MTNDLIAHLKGKLTNVCRCWKISCNDGTVLGFTDHDCDLNFEGLTFRADSGLTASALAQGSGLAVDNTEAMGVLDSEVLTERDIAGGRFDGAEVVTWLVNWAETTQRMIQFRGSIGEITRSGGVFRAELRGLSDALNQARGRVFQKPCSAVLGDVRCGVDLTLPAFSAIGKIVSVDGVSSVKISVEGDYPDRWFERGRLTLGSGGALGIKRDDPVGELRKLGFPEGLQHPPEIGSPVRLIAGCDRRIETCRVKFDNIVNFQGFPDIPGEDWLTTFPKSGQKHDGGSRR